jgi:prepilin-type N-terminal cleavage/methylation domain-containing protein
MRRERKREAGFSLTELVVALAVALILAGIGLPSFLRAYRSYQLTNAATQVADILRLTRYEAIRMNTQVNCVIQANGDTTNVSTVVNNGTADPGQKSIVLLSAGNLVDAGGVPATGALATAAHIGAGVVNPSPTSGTVQFDARGAVMPTGTVSVLYLANTTTADPGYRAVILLPAGSIQIWTSDGTGSWIEIR